ncbi:MAG: alginate export family protein [Myxococcales bacterium]|nr:alginate export family protein [Myxococcales bacterium]
MQHLMRLSWKILFFMVFLFSFHGVASPPKEEQGPQKGVLCASKDVSRCETLHHGETSQAPRPRGFQVKYRRGHGLEMDLLGDGHWVLRVGADIYARPEIHVNRGDFSWAKNDKDEYVASRMRLNVEFLAMKHFGFRLGAQDARYWGNSLGSEGGFIRFSPDYDVQLHREVFLGPSFFEGYLFIDRPYGLPFRLEAGRKELNYGEGFVLGAPQYIPQGQSFDQLMLRWFLGPVEVDMMWLKIRESLIISDTSTCTDGCFFDGDDLYGIYATYHPRRDMKVELYGMFFLRSPRTGEPLEMQQIGYVGARYGVINPRWHISLEFVGQFGRYRQKTLLAFSGWQKLAYTFQNPLRPFVGFQLMFASGDGNPNDDTDNNFVPLFPKRRYFYGFINLLGASNIVQPMVDVGFHPHKDVRLSLEARFSMKWSAKSPFINGGGHAPILADSTGASGQALGWEMGMRVTWQPVPFFHIDLTGAVFVPQAGGILSKLSQEANSVLGQDPALLGFVWMWMRL